MQAPVATEAPLAVQEPVDVQEPVATESPLVVQEPVYVQAPVATEAPLAVQAPVVVQALVDMQATEAPVVVQEPVVVQAPVDVQAPVATEAPVVVQGPVVTEALAPTLSWLTMQPPASKKVQLRFISRRDWTAMPLPKRRICTDTLARGPLLVLEDPEIEIARQFKNQVFISTQTSNGCCVDSRRGTVAIVRRTGSALLPLLRIKHGNIESISLFNQALYHDDPVIWGVEFPLKLC